MQEEINEGHEKERGSRIENNQRIRKSSSEVW
jgi:hypothetical protein